jgi:hypothetical protein
MVASRAKQVKPSMGKLGIREKVYIMNSVLSIVHDGAV